MDPLIKSLNLNRSTEVGIGAPSLSCYCSGESSLHILWYGEELAYLALYVTINMEEIQDQKGISNRRILEGVACSTSSRSERQKG